MEQGGSTQLRQHAPCCIAARTKVSHSTVEDQRMTACCSSNPRSAAARQVPLCSPVWCERGGAWEMELPQAARHRQDVQPLRCCGAKTGQTRQLAQLQVPLRQAAKVGPCCKVSCGQAGRQMRQQLRAEAGAARNAVQRRQLAEERRCCG